MIRPLTSLRLLFALMVFASHCNILSPRFDVPLLTEGYVGVSFFFVLSGFIIAYSYDERFASGTTDKRTFWVARVPRLYTCGRLLLFLQQPLVESLLRAALLPPLPPRGTPAASSACVVEALCLECRASRGRHVCHPRGVG